MLVAAGGLGWWPGWWSGHRGGVHHPAKTVGEHQPVRVVGVAGDPQPALVMQPVMPRTQTRQIPSVGRAGAVVGVPVDHVMDVQEPIGACSPARDSRGHAGSRGGGCVPGTVRWVRPTLTGIPPDLVDGGRRSCRSRSGRAARRGGGSRARRASCCRHRHGHAPGNGPAAPGRRSCRGSGWRSPPTPRPWTPRHRRVGTGRPGLRASAVLRIAPWSASSSPRSSQRPSSPCHNDNNSTGSTTAGSG